MEKELTGKQQLETEIRTVDTLLDRGIRIQLPAPRLLRWLGKPTIGFTVKRPSSATLFEISALYLKMKGCTDKLDPTTLDESHQLIYDCMVPASRIVAYAIQPTTTPLGIRNRLLARYLRQQLNTHHLTELWVMVCSLSGAHDFSNIIRSMSGMRITMPRTMN
ncbi:MAG: hypothetical protein LUD02_02630 [Tannerellaceae bacterium]|nr:hypothetical protein [Tannerellaceae bacterium]MCD8263171.1 hypothetical protein [Tannerellaceae bacterium]